MAMIPEAELEHLARCIVSVLRLSGATTDADRLWVLTRAGELLDGRTSKALCGRCHMLIEAEPDGEASHVARCGLPCGPVEGFALPHMDMDDCLICGSELLKRARSLIAEF